MKIKTLVSPEGNWLVDESEFKEYEQKTARLKALAEILQCIGCSPVRESVERQIAHIIEADVPSEYQP